jgi:ribosomal protein S18 acetylase RimI-like enzyme
MNLSSIRPGRLEDLPELQRLHAGSLRSYYYDDLGDGEEPELCKGVNAVLVDRHTGKLNGFLAFDRVWRSQALPDTAPSKVPLRAAAISSAGAAARLQFRALFEHTRLQLPPQPQDYLFYALTDQGWLRASLQESGFEHCDAVRFYERSSRAVETVFQPAALRPAQPSDLPQLARLDAAAFEPLWHMGETELRHLHRDCRIEIAEMERTTVGYSALRLFSDGSPRGFGSAQLVRLAVHPGAQSRGIGRQLLAASLCYAHRLRTERVFLNTQESNTPSRNLYESLRFRKRGRSVPVFVNRVRQCQAQPFTR